MRRKVIAGNWKMNKSPNDTKKFMEVFKPLVENSKNEIIVCTPFIDLHVAIEMSKSTNIKIGAQNMHFEEKGAYTGEVSSKMLEDIGVEYVIIGHSERREYYNETDESVNKKIKSAFCHNLKPIVCVGETLAQREEKITKEFVTNQVKLALDGLSANEVSNTIIAYEPIWAIGTGKTASAYDANEVCTWIRNEIQNLFGEVAKDVIILYGGSVKSSNAKELFSMSDIDGGLIGGASMDAEEFAKIVNFDN